MSVKDALAGLRSDTIPSYAQTLVVVAELGEASIVAVTRERRLTRQAVHGQLIKLIARGLLTRDKRGVEYFYRLAEGVDAGEVDELWANLNQGSTHGALNGLPRLPEFDSSWPEARQEWWFNAYEKLLLVVENQNRS